MTDRRLVTSGTPLEPEIGFSRTVRVGAHVTVAGNTPLAAGGATGASDDIHGQTMVSEFIDPDRIVEVEADAIVL